MRMRVTCSWLSAALALVFAAALPIGPAVAGPGIAAAVQSVPADQGLMSRIDLLLSRALLTADRADLARDIAAGPASVQRDCARLDLELRAGHRKTAEGLLTQLSARPEFARARIPSGVISFIVRRNRGQGLTDVALAVKLYRRFPDPELPELRDVLTFISNTEGDQAAARLLAGLPYTEQVSLAVGWWCPGVEKRGHVEDVARTFKAAGRGDLVKAIRGQPVAPKPPPVEQRMRPGAVVAPYQNAWPAAPAAPDTAEDWLAKAGAAVRRGDVAAADAAFLRALALAPVPPRAVHMKGGPIRARVLAEYRRFLIQQERPDEGVALLRQEIAGAGLNSLSGRFALRTLCEWSGVYPGAAIKPDDELLWQALGKSEEWDWEEAQCLNRMAGKLAGYAEPRGTPGPGWMAAYVILERAEKLCESAHPSRAAVVGRLWLDYCRPERAVPLLEHAASHSEHLEESSQVREDLLRAYLNAGLASEAERSLPALAERHPEEATLYYAKLAVAWVKAGDTTRAMQSWRKVVNIDATQLGYLPVWAMEGGRTVVSADATPPRYPPGRPEARFRSELEQFYRSWQEADKESWVPPLALRLLDADMDTWVSIVGVN